MQKEMRNKLYSHFVKSGTLEGGKLVQNDEDKTEIEEVKDLSKIRTMSDDELVKSCGGRTAHKGARHGQNMTAKLQRVADADSLLLAKMLEMQQAKTTKNKSASLKPNKSENAQSEVTVSDTGKPKNNQEKVVNEDIYVEKKAKKRKKDKEELDAEEKPNKRKKKKSESSHEEEICTIPRKKHKKHKKGKESESIEANVSAKTIEDSEQIVETNLDISKKKKKSKKHKKSS